VGGKTGRRGGRRKESLTNDNKGTLKGHVSKSMVCVYEINNGEMKSISHLSQRERERER
jgi:hypothetical protein